MKNYKVTYSGQSRKFKNFETNIHAESERQAVENVYKYCLDENYFPEEDGTIKDCDGHIIAKPTDVVIEYHGGFFNANEI